MSPFRSSKHDCASTKCGHAISLVQADARRILDELKVHASVTGAADRPVAESAIAELYHLGGLGPPRFVWVDSPEAATQLWYQEPDGPGIKGKLLSWRLNEQPDQGIDPGDPTYSVLSGVASRPLHSIDRVDPQVLDRQLELWATLLRSAGWWWATANRCIVSEPPDEVHLETVHLEPTGGVTRLHCETGPALRYRDGSVVHAWHGVIVAEKVIAGELTAQDWRTERNSERRRAMAERMGYAWLLDHSAAEKIAEGRYSSLWRVPNRELDDEETLAVCHIPSSYVAEEDRPPDILLVHHRRGTESAVLRVDSAQEYFHDFEPDHR